MGKRRFIMVKKRCVLCGYKYDHDHDHIDHPNDPYHAFHFRAGLIKKYLPEKKSAPKEPGKL